jgi:lantibiotic modifying enzyme
MKVEELGFFRFSRTPLVLKKGEDFHTQKVEKNERTDEYGVNLYYKRAGALLFFAYLLGSNDLHCENLIANGDMPVVIDMETLLTGKPRGTSDAYNLSQSVMRSHLLCSFMNVQGKTVDVSGFGGVTAELKNIPHTEKGKAFPWDKKDVFRKGFESAYVFAIKHKEELLKLTHVFDRCKFRQILRPTKTYDAVSAVLSKIDGNTKEYATMLLSRAYEKDTDKNRLEKAKLVLQNEVDAVMKNEIPLSYTYGNETSLYCNGHKVQSEHLVLSPVD